MECSSVSQSIILASVQKTKLVKLTFYNVLSLVNIRLSFWLICLNCVRIVCVTSISIDDVIRIKARLMFEKEKH